MCWGDGELEQGEFELIELANELRRVEKLRLHQAEIERRLTAQTVARYDNLDDPFLRGTRHRINRNNNKMDFRPQVQEAEANEAPSNHPI